MPHKIKFNAPTAGEHEIELPPEFMHSDEVKASFTPKDSFKEELDRRVASITKGLAKPEDLMADPAFLKTLTEKKRNEMVTMLGLTDQPDIRKMQEEVTARIRTEEVEPLKKAGELAGIEISGLRVRDLDAQVLDSASKLRAVPGLVDLMKKYVRDLVDWDPKYKQWFVKKPDGDGFEISSDPKKGGFPYKGVRELMEGMARDPEKKAWFETGTQSGAGFTGNDGDARGTTLEMYQKMAPVEQTIFAQKHPEEFTRIMSEIQSAGESKLFARR